MTYFWAMRLGRARIAFAPDGGAGAGGADPNAGGADPAAGGADPNAGGTPPADGGADPAAGAAGKWWETDQFSEEDRHWIKARGLADDDTGAVLMKAVKGHREAEKRLGRKPEDLLDRPKDGQSVSEWLAESRAKLGLPEAEDGYKVDPPEGWPEGAPWDTELEAKARKLAFEAGIPPETHQALVALYADKVRQMDEASQTDLAQATEAMMTDLRRDWGEQTPARIAQAKQAAGVLAERAGIDGEALNNLAGVLSDKTGDANVLRLFAAIGEMMGDDAAVSIGRNTGGLGPTPAEARAEIERISAPGGEYHAAFNGGGPEAQKRMQARMLHLSKIAAQGK